MAIFLYFFNVLRPVHLIKEDLSICSVRSFNVRTLTYALKLYHFKYRSCVGDCLLSVDWAILF